jgi:pilus assembly protein CpaD
MPCLSSALAGRSGPGSTAVRALAVVGLAAMLTGCFAKQETTGSVSNDYRQRHPIVIKESDRTIELFIGTGRGGLTPSQRADVAGFAQGWRREATGGVAIDLPAGTSNERAAAESLHEVRAMLIAAGVPARGIVVRPYRPTDMRAFATLRLNYPRIAADAGPCGLWPNDLGPSLDRNYTENRSYSNLGCAAQRNLAAMVDNPADLVQPRSETPAYAIRRNTVLDKYGKGESPATKHTDADKGKLSDVGR